MTDKVEQKLVEMLDSLQNGVITVGDSIIKYSPDIVDSVLWVIRLEAIHTLILSLFGLIAAGSYLRWLYIYIKNHDGDIFLDDIIPGLLILGMIVFLLCVPMTLNILSVWNWVAIFEPELAIAHDIITAARGK